MAGHRYLHKATPVAPTQAQLCISVCKIHKISLIIVNPWESVLSSIICLIVLALPLFFFCQIPGIHHILYFLRRRHVHGAAALQKSKPLSNTPFWLQNPVMAIVQPFPKCFTLPLTVTSHLSLSFGSSVDVLEKGKGRMPKVVIKFPYRTFLYPPHAQTRTHQSELQRAEGKCR